MPSRTATARSSAPSSSPKRFYKGSYRNSASPSSGQRRGPTKGYNNQFKFSKKVPNAKSGKPFHHKRQNNHDYPKHNMLLHRLSPPSSSPSGTLLERIGGSIDDEAVSALTHSDRRIDEECVLEAVDICSGSVPFSTTPHFYTPDPGEVEQFLESVIGALPGPPSSPGSGHACSPARIKDKPPLAVETHNLPWNHLVEDPSSSVLYSPTQTAVNSMSSANLALDHQQGSLLGDTTMVPPSTSTIEECRKHLVPVLLASAQAKDAGKRLDSEQCLRLLSDDHCRGFFRQAKEMRLQLSPPVSQKTPVNRSWSGSLKRDRVDEVDAWVRKTRSRFNSTNTVISDVSRKDSDITLVDVTRGRLPPPKAPRAMLQTSQAVLNKLPDSAQEQAPYEALVASPITQNHPTSATSLIELVHEAIKMFPPLVPTSEPETGLVDTSDVPMGHPTGEQSGHPNQVSSPTVSSTSPSSIDFTSHLPTQPGVWFKLQGRQYAEIVDVDIEVSDEIFYMSGERQPFRLRTHLRLCSVPLGAAMQNNSGDTPASFRDVIEHDAVHWPKKGKLVVQVNPESERSKTWLPHTLESDPLDVTSCMRPGKNTFRFIQLSDLSEFTFVLVASPPPPEEEWRSWDWESLVARSRTRSSSTDDDMNGLSEFARLPIIVRS